MTVSIWQITAQTPRPQLSTDVVVIGAGLLGCSAAIFLKELGQEVIILEARDVGLGASSRNAGFVLTGLDTYYHQAEAHYGREKTRQIWQSSKQTHQFWFKIARQYQVPFRQSSSLLLAESESEARDLEQAAQRMNEEGFPCQFLPHDPLGRGYCAAIRQPEDGEIQPYDLVQALFKESGAHLIGACEVYALESEKEGIVVQAAKAMIRARHVLICTNAYSAALDPFFAEKIIPHRAQCLATAPWAERLINSIGYSDYGYMYYRDLPEGGLLIGGGRKLYKAQEANTSDDRITEPVQSTLDRYLQKHFPEVAHLPIVRRWAGIMGFTPDGLPLVGRLPRDPRIGFAVGFNGHGLSLGAMAAKQAVEHLIEGESAGLFDAARLGAT
jgi:glycine/D-amino acid oxidase-like deaminating enzyme